MEDELKEKSHICHEECPVTRALEIIGGKWRIPIIWKLSTEKGIRYNELKRSIPGITNIMLTRSLQSLEEHGLVKRVQYNKIPPHVEYSLTDSCHDLMPALAIINEWGKHAL
ncbi:transcriptional regulator [Clostridium gelidum]|uniref:Transcriptional regulator n=1 Tax=Clostridium gelidum TaxID=704125 RepID=A0ABN6IQS3_9CLOT|nr:helix-turn-helix domain-containing protein [Clostridium gelidum]BCZ44556.1 transcriptional regulator [Clostridium gelidum]